MQAGICRLLARRLPDAAEDSRLPRPGSATTPCRSAVQYDLPLAALCIALSGEH